MTFPFTYRAWAETPLAVSLESVLLLVIALLLFRFSPFSLSLSESERDEDLQLLLGIWDAFKEHGIEISFPQRDLHIRSDFRKKAND